MNPTMDWPDPDEERRLLDRLATGSRTAREELAVRYLPLLMGLLAAEQPRVEAELRDDAAGRALIDLLSAPGGFDPAKGTLGKYLRMAARGDLLNLVAKDRRARRGVPLASVEEPAERRNHTRDDELSWGHPALAAELAALGRDEAVALELMCNGVRSTAEFARRLDITHLSAGAQVAVVKRLKDRVKKRLVRAAEGLR